VEARAERLVELKLEHGLADEQLVAVLAAAR
jgi:hypothetical protein